MKCHPIHAITPKHPPLSVFLGLSLSLSLSLSLCASAGFAQAPVFQGTTTQLTTDLGQQFDPSISGNIVVYTDTRNNFTNGRDIYYVDLTNPGVEHPVAVGPGSQRLHDVSAPNIVYTDQANGGSDIVTFDVNTGTSQSLAQPGIVQAKPTIDQQMVTYESIQGGLRSIAVTQLGSTLPPLLMAKPATCTTCAEFGPSISGTQVAYERMLDAFGTSFAVVVADTATGTPQTIATGRRPHIDAGRVAYTFTTTAGDTDICVYDIGLATNNCIAMAGNQARAHLSGDYLAFDDQGTGDLDIVLYHLPTGTTVRIGTAGTNEFLNDVDANHVAYTSDVSGNQDIWLYTFTLANWPPPPPPPPVPGDDCNDDDDDDEGHDSDDCDEDHDDDEEHDDDDEDDDHDDDDDQDHHRQEALLKASLAQFWMPTEAHRKTDRLSALPQIELPKFVRTRDDNAAAMSAGCSQTGSAETGLLSSLGVFLFALRRRKGVARRRA